MIDQLNTDVHECCMHCHHQRILILLKFIQTLMINAHQSTKAEALREQEYQCVCMVRGGLVRGTRPFTREEGSGNITIRALPRCLECGHDQSDHSVVNAFFRMQHINFNDRVYSRYEHGRY